MRTASLALTLLTSCLVACGPARPTAHDSAGSLTDGTDVVDSTFIRFRLSTQAGPCLPGAVLFGCVKAVELRADGFVFRQDGDAIAVAKVSPADLAAAVRVVTDPEFVRLLGTFAPCDVVLFDTYEKMELERVGTPRAEAVTLCRNEPAIQAVRTEMARLLSVRYPL